MALLFLTLKVQTLRSIRCRSRETPSTRCSGEFGRSAALSIRRPDISAPLDPRACLKKGGTGHRPVPVGDPPTGMERRSHEKKPAYLVEAFSPLRPASRRTPQASGLFDPKQNLQIGSEPRICFLPKDQPEIKLGLRFNLSIRSKRSVGFIGGFDQIWNHNIYSWSC